MGKLRVVLSDQHGQVVMDKVVLNKEFSVASGVEDAMAEVGYAVEQLNVDDEHRIIMRVETGSRVLSEDEIEKIQEKALDNLNVFLDI